MRPPSKLPDFRYGRPVATNSHQTFALRERNQSANGGTCRVARSDVTQTMRNSAMSRPDPERNLVVVACEGADQQLSPVRRQVKDDRVFKWRGQFLHATAVDGRRHQRPLPALPRNKIEARPVGNDLATGRHATGVRELGYFQYFRILGWPIAPDSQDSDYTCSEQENARGQHEPMRFGNHAWQSRDLDTRIWRNLGF